MIKAFTKIHIFHLFQISERGQVYTDVDGYMLTGEYNVFLSESSRLATNKMGRVYYRESTDIGILKRASFDVAGSGSGFEASFAVIVTWHQITYEGGSNDSPVSVLLFT